MPKSRKRKPADNEVLAVALGILPELPPRAGTSMNPSRKLLSTKSRGVPVRISDSENERALIKFLGHRQSPISPIFDFQTQPQKGVSSCHQSLTINSKQQELPR